MNENRKIIELKNKIEYKDFRRQEEIIKNKKRKEKLNAPKQKKRKFNIINLIFIVFVLYFAYTIFNQNKMINILDEQIAQKDMDKSKIQKIAEELKLDVDKINEDESLLELVEKVARDEYKMVKPNETIYIDKNKNGNKFIKGIFNED